MTLEDRLEKIKSVLDANKGEEIETFNLDDTEYMVSGVVIATAMADKHLDALLNFLKQDLKPEEEFLHVDSSNEWVVADLGDILVHLMTKSAREKYHLENFLTEFAAKKSNS